MLTVKCDLLHITGTWQDLAGYAEPSIKHIRLKNLRTLPLRDGMVTTVVNGRSHAGCLPWTHGILLPELLGDPKGGWTKFEDDSF